jgi:hypothetical protein
MIQPGNRRAGPYTSGTNFPFGFKVFAAADIVFTKTSAAGVDSILVLGTDYTVTLNPDQENSPGGTVAYPSLGAGEMVTITSNMAASQTYDVTNAGGFYPSAMEDALDRAIILVQQLYEKVARAVVLPVSSSLANVFLPVPAANRGLKWNSTGTGLVNTSTDPDVAGAASAAAAAASAAAAATSAGNAATSESNAAGYVTAAAAQATNAQNSYIAADKKYLGAKASDPTLDNQGAALVVGAWYFNSTAGQNRVWSGTVWVAVSSGGGGGAASGVTFAPTGNISSTDVQSAIAEVDSEKLAASGSNLTPAGTTQGSASLITTRISVCAPGANTAIRLPPAIPGDERIVYNTSTGTNLQVFPATGEAIDGGATNAAFNARNGASGKTCYIFQCVAAGAWKVTRGATLSSSTPLALGTAASGTSNEVSRDDHVHPVPPYGGMCYLSLSGANLLLSRQDGIYIVINNAVQAIPPAGVSLAPTALTPGTNYYIYAWMNGGTMTLEASTTAYAVDTTSGVTIKSGDATRTLVGMARCVTGPAWADSTTQAFVLSWFNRRRKSLTNTFTTTRSVTSTSVVEINTEIRIEFLTWAAETVDICVVGNPGNTTLAYTYVAEMIDGSNLHQSGSMPGGGSGNSTVAAIVRQAGGLSEGYHYLTMGGAVGSGTASFNAGSSYCNAAVNG